MSENTSGDEETTGVWPGDDFVLCPPPGNDNAGNIYKWSFILDKVSAAIIDT